MSIVRGCFGKVKSGASSDLVAEVTAWDFDESAEIIDTTSMGTCTKSFEVGAAETKGNVSCWWDSADTGQGNFAVGTTVDIDLYPGGDASGAKYYSGTGVITSIKRSGAVNTVVSVTFAFSVQGAMTLATAA